MSRWISYPSDTAHPALQPDPNGAALMSSASSGKRMLADLDKHTPMMQWCEVPQRQGLQAISCRAYTVAYTNNLLGKRKPAEAGFSGSLC